MLRILLCFILCCTGNSVIYSQDIEFQKFLLESNIENQKGYVTELPVLNNINNAVLIKVRIDDKIYNFVFDTGAMISVISDEAAGNAPRLEKISLTNISGNSQKAETVKKDIVLNDIVFRDLGFAITNLDNINKYSCIKIDGILGANAIRLCNWRIDMQTHTLTLSDLPFAADSNDFTADIKYYAQLLPLIELYLDKEKFLVLIDTGFTGSFNLNEEIYSKSGKSKTLTSKTGNGFHISSYNESANGKITKVKLDSVYVNSHLFQNINTVVNNGKSLLGLGFFSDYITTINIEENKLYMKPVNNSINKIKDFGINIVLEDNNELTVGFIWDKSKLQKAGIRLGEKITEVNGKKTDKLTSDEYCVLKNEINSSDKLILKIKHKKEEKEFQFIAESD